MAARSVIAVLLVLLSATCLAQSPDPLDGLQSTSLAPLANALEENEPLKEAFLGVPSFAQLVYNPELAASTPEIDLLLNNPDLLAAVAQTPTTLDPDEALTTFEDAMPPALARIVKLSAAEPTSSDTAADIARNTAQLRAAPGDVETVQAAYANGNRKMM